MTKKILDNTLSRQLRWLMLFRVVTTTFLLGTTFVVQFRHVGNVSDEALAALYSLIGSLYFLTFLYALVLPKLVQETTQANIQISGDILITTVVIYLTGGLESTFSFMYILAIINAGILLKIRGAVVAASLSAILYGALLDLHYYRYIDPYLTRFSYLDHYRATDILNTILVNMGAFYLVAILSGYLSKQTEESRQKLAESQFDLERLEDLNESIIQSIDSGLVTLGSRGEILSCNPAAERITGISFNQVKSRSYIQLFPGLTLPSDMLPAQNPAPLWNWTHRRKDGQELYLDMGLLQLRDRSGEHWGRLLVFQDRTALRQMEAEVERVERLAAIGELAAGIAHEIRNPLASMSGSLQMLEADLSEGGDRARLMAIIKREMERLNRIVNDFLLFARPRFGKPDPVNLSRTVEDNLKMFQNQLHPEDGINVVTQVTPEVWIYFDQTHLEQIMWNLLRNAKDAMSEGGRMTVTVGRPEKYVDMAQVAVSDTGAGISQADLNKIYDPFFTTKEGGNGLGLSIIHRILEDGKGRIEVSSLEGEGTTFTVYLPVLGTGD